MAVTIGLNKHSILKFWVFYNKIYQPVYCVYSFIHLKTLENFSFRPKRQNPTYRQLITVSKTWLICEVIDNKYAQVITNYPQNWNKLCYMKKNRCIAVQLWYLYAAVQVWWLNMASSFTSSRLSWHDALPIYSEKTNPPNNNTCRPPHRSRLMLVTSYICVWMCVCVCVCVFCVMQSSAIITGELWGVFCEDFGENWPRYYDTALYYLLCDITISVEFCWWSGET